MVFQREHSIHMLCETEKFMNIWLRRPQQDLILPPNIRLHRHPHCPNSWKIFCQTSSVLTCRNCTVCQTKFMMLYAGHFITDNTCNNLITIHLNLWMCLVRDSGLFIFLMQILIWSYSIAVLSRLYLAWIQNKELHKHKHTSVQYPDCFLFLQCLAACMTSLCRFLSYKWHVRPILVVSCQPHCLLPHIPAAGSVAPCFDVPLSRRTVSSQCGRSKFPPAQYTLGPGVA